MSNETTTEQPQAFTWASNPFGSEIKLDEHFVIEIDRDRGDATMSCNGSQIAYLGDGWDPDCDEDRTSVLDEAGAFLQARIAEMERVQ